jgi:hypothetical protein
MIKSNISKVTINEGSSSLRLMGDSLHKVDILLQNANREIDDSDDDF